MAAAGAIVAELRARCALLEVQAGTAAVGAGASAAAISEEVNRLRSQLAQVQGMGEERAGTLFGSCKHPLCTCVQNSRM